MGYNVAIDGPAGAGKSNNCKAGCKRKRIYLCRYRRNVPWIGHSLSESWN